MKQRSLEPNVGQIGVGYFESRSIRILGRGHGACKVPLKANAKKTVKGEI